MTDTPRDSGEVAEAVWLHEHRDEVEKDAANADDIEFAVVKPLSVTTSFRMNADEAAAIRKAAEHVGMTQSEWIRRVCVAAATAPTPQTLSPAEQAAMDALRAAVEKLRTARAAESEFIEKAELILKAS